MAPQSPAREAFRQLHFISGLPRSGSMLLAAILRQNPRFQAGMSTMLADLVADVIRHTSSHESSRLLSTMQKEALVRSVTEAYYTESTEPVVFDTSRRWCALMPQIAHFFPLSRVICCVRSPAWIIDSFECAMERNPLIAPRMFGHEISNVYQRTEKMIKDTLVGGSMSALRQAWFGKHAGRLIAVRYDSLVADPGVIERLHEALGEPLFIHNFESVEYDSPELDSYLGVPGLIVSQVGCGMRSVRRFCRPTSSVSTTSSSGRIQGRTPEGYLYCSFLNKGAARPLEAAPAA